MGYIFRGRLCGWLCDDYAEPLAGLTLRLYSPTESDQLRRAVVDPKETLALYAGDEVGDRGRTLLGEAVIDETGGFKVELPDSTYQGGALDVDLYCATVPHRPPHAPRANPVQLAVTTLQPQWRRDEQTHLARWEYCLPRRVWCAVRARFDSWVICGRLRTCEGGQPVAGAVVNAFDADWWQDDPLGSATTDGAGRFRIDYTSADFQRTPFSPWVNVELQPGPDVYFTVDLGGHRVLTEHQGDGRAAGRRNVGHCFCVELCTEAVLPPESVPHWQRIEAFDIHPLAGQPGSQWDSDGYVGAGKVVFGGAVQLHGNCPLTNAAEPSHPLQYRFTYGEWSQPGGAELPGVVPSIPPAGPPVPVTAIHPTTVGYLFYADGHGAPSSAPVNITSADAAADGWITVLGKVVTVDMHDGTTASITVSASNFLRTFDLITLDSVAISNAHPVKLPEAMPPAEAGRALLAAEQEPIRRYRLTFEARDAVTHAGVATDTVESVVLDNRAVVVALNLEELFSAACTPVADATTVHLLYTIDHPHLDFFRIGISNNSGAVHGAPPLPGQEFGGSVLFRGGHSGPHQPSLTGGVAVDVSADPPCSYAVTLSWRTRRYGDPGHSTQVRYCR